MGFARLPVQLGVDRAARLACLVMAAPQVVVIALLLVWGCPGTRGHRRAAARRAARPDGAC